MTDYWIDNMSVDDFEALKPSHEDDEDDMFAFSDSDSDDDEPATMDDIRQMQALAQEAQKDADRASKGTIATMFTVGGVVLAFVVWFVLHVVKHV